jgi:rubrerythrin
MKQEKEKLVKAYEFFCSCGYDWISRNDDTICPQCKNTILEFCKLR